MLGKVHKEKDCTEKRTAEVWSGTIRPVKADLRKYILLEEIKEISVDNMCSKISATSTTMPTTKGCIQQIFVECKNNTLRRFVFIL